MKRPYRAALLSAAILALSFAHLNASARAVCPESAVWQAAHFLPVKGYELAVIPSPKKLHFVGVMLDTHSMIAECQYAAPQKDAVSPTAKGMKGEQLAAPETHVLNIRLASSCKPGKEFVPTSRVVGGAMRDSKGDYLACFDARENRPVTSKMCTVSC